MVNNHIAQCPTCGQRFDMRNLGEALFHNFGECMLGSEPKKVPFGSVRKVGEPVEYTRIGVVIYLN